MEPDLKLSLMSPLEASVDNSGCDPEKLELN